MTRLSAVHFFIWPTGSCVFDLSQGPPTPADENHERAASDQSTKHQGKLIQHPSVLLARYDERQPQRTGEDDDGPYHVNGIAHGAFNPLAD